ncbi:MAG: hypothetical protein PVF83_08070 [Anaerolineales bacterium]
MQRIKKHTQRIFKNPPFSNRVIEYGIIGFFLIGIILLYLNTTPYYDLFAGDQHGYYLRGMYLAGREYLQNDWVSENNTSYHIAFTLLVYALDSLGILEPAIGVLDIVFRVVFLLGIWLILYTLWNQYFAKEEASPLRKSLFPLVIFFIFSHSINPVNPLSKVFESLNLVWLGGFWRTLGDLGGIARLWLYGFRVNPSSFAVFILLGLSLLPFRRWKSAAVCFGIAALFHISYLTQSGLIVLILTVHLIRRNEKRTALQSFLIFSIIVLPLVVYFLMNLPAGSTPEANEILFQLTDGSDLKAIWRGIDSVHIIIIIFAGLVFWIIGKGRVFPLIFNINVLYAIVGMSISLLTSNRFLGLLMPWRACTYLYPISVIVLFTTTLYYTNHLLDKVNLKLKYGIVLLSLLLFIVGANQYGIISPKKNFRYQRSDAGNYPFYTKVTEQTIPDEVILIPVDDHAFRLDAKRAVYVDGRNLPGWGEILIGWIERINFANSFYELEGSERQIACQDAGVDYYALYGIEPSEIETVVVRWKDKTLIKCPIDFSD